jgi:hypothetical protein
VNPFLTVDLPVLDSRNFSHTFPVAEEWLRQQFETFPIARYRPSLFVNLSVA